MMTMALVMMNDNDDDTSLTMMTIVTIVTVMTLMTMTMMTIQACHRKSLLSGRLDTSAVHCLVHCADSYIL